MPRRDWRQNDPLCCCEYLSSDGERSHVLECCCNCVILDETCERLVTCRRIHSEHISGIMNVIHDRFRVPWRGGAKQISCDSIFPILVLPLLAFIAVHNIWCTVVAFVTLQVSLLYAYRIYLKKNPHSRLLFVWVLTSVVLLIFVFETSVVPLMEILPEENITFVALVVTSLFCLYKVCTRATLNHVTSSNDSRDEVILSRSKATESICPACRKRVPPRTYHCSICQACVLKKEYHYTWLNCCIGEKNNCLFVLGIFFSFLSLLYGAILTLTSVCHPFFFLDIVLLPDDCSDVYHDPEIALCFVSAVYSLLLAILLLCIFTYHCWLISLGLTTQEWQELHGADSKCLGLNAHRPYDKGVLANWTQLLCCRTNTVNT